MSFAFPQAPVVNQIYEYRNYRFRYNGLYWDLISSDSGVQVLWEIFNSALVSATPGLFPVLGLVENNVNAAAENTRLIQIASDQSAEYGALHPPLHSYQGIYNKGGGKALIPPGYFYVDRSILPGLESGCVWVGNGAALSGMGPATHLILKPGVASTAAPCSGIRVRDNTSWVVVENLSYNGSWDGNSTDTGKASHGLNLVRTGTSDFYDGGFSARNLFLFNCQGHGLQGAGPTTTLRGWNIYSYHNADSGFSLKTDQALWGCKAGNNAGDGFTVGMGSNVLISSSKAFGNKHADFSVAYSESVQLDNVQIEDFSGIAAIYISVVRNCRVNAAIYRCQSVEGLNAAVWVEDAGTGQTNPYHTERPFSNIIDVACYFQTPSGSIVYPKHHLITRNVGAANQIRIVAVPGSWQNGRHNNLGGSADGQISFNGTGRDIVQNPVFAASYTPDPELGEIVFYPALTANLTVNAPVNPVRGMKLHFFFTQNGSGGWTVTFNSVFKKTGGAFTATAGANTKCNIAFMYDGTAWQETSRNLAVA